MTKNVGIENQGQIVAKRVRSCRERLNMTQSDLARAAEVGQPNISRLETGRVETLRAKDLSRIALALNTSTDYLLGVVDQLRPEELIIRDPLAKEFLKAYQQMSADEREELWKLLPYIRDHRSPQRRRRERPLERPAA
ncbi:MAG: helix-turn-helix transcriptional regulator [Deltaproteobacteria bacterium]|nr:helix-turn-helix transcriptional regulator [Deltaproteobacteria bacterium]